MFIVEVAGVGGCQSRMRGDVDGVLDVEVAAVEVAVAVAVAAVVGIVAAVLAVLAGAEQLHGLEVSQCPLWDDMDKRHHEDVSRIPAQRNPP